MTEPQVKSSIAELTEKEVQIDKEKFVYQYACRAIHAWVSVSFGHQSMCCKGKNILYIHRLFTNLFLAL